ncbi:hypothetical protein QBC47DRAFT_392858 [Echria macrotheca]|uniref:Uncharacterized protein n=1 Tax=Echria macrotheca TaxID=438768 RepID=A0AAJ0B3I3_9PEZI|nr:hypothetical protein QBC47DRAFT_392858 [Echria macrotheca]
MAKPNPRILTALTRSAQPSVSSHFSRANFTTQKTYATSQQSKQQPQPETNSVAQPPNADAPQERRKTQAELDEELRMKLEGISGDGGGSGVEYEDGKAVAMKRSVKNNMFRYI